jgi:carbon storage regulator
MLILTRKVDQGIVIQDNILVTVLRVDGDRVMIGISAPRDVTVLRQELLNQEGRRAATSRGQEPSGRETASV